MTTVGESNAAPGQRRNVFTRLALVITSPEAAYADVAARPAALGALAVVMAVMIVSQFLFLSTDVGQEAMIDQQIRTVEAFGMTITDRMEADFRASAGNARYTTAIGQLVTIPIATALIAALLLAIFNAVSERSSTFRHLYAVAAHSGAVLAVQAVVITPISYLMGEMTTVTRLSVFFPMLSEDSFLSFLLGGIELFTIWWLVNLAIGVAVLYRRPVRPVAVTLLGIYGVLVVAIAVLRVVF